MSEPTTGDSHPTSHKHGGLGQLASTAICGNDITSSCLYVSALAIGYAGRWAPVCLLLVAGTLYLFRSIYAEVVGALPLNGGAYNALLNTTSKYRASIAACLTILSYMATAVISSNEAMHYLHSLWHGLPVIPATIGLLAVFMCLAIVGITESAVVAIGIFVFHLFSMLLLMSVGIYSLTQFGLDIFWANMRTPTVGGFGHALFFGFAAAMLGISGFESSANFVEEQAEGVFPKTLRNMWIAVTVLNPGMAILALAVVPIPQVAEQYQNTLLSHMGETSGGSWLAWLISIDAILVLSGATLTSYVGVTGLVGRMTLDRCLPRALSKLNRRKTPYRIIVTFFVLCVSVLLITGGELKSLAAVYTLSFLSVMAFFAIGNLLLKIKRPRLPRPTEAGYPTLLVALTAVTVAILGNARLNQAYLIVFLEYFAPTLLVVTIMLTRLKLLELLVFFTDRVRRAIGRERKDAFDKQHFTQARWWRRIGIRIRWIEDWMYRKIQEVSAQQIVFFTRGDSLGNLNRVMQYIEDNEHTDRVRIVTVVQAGEQEPPELAEQLKFLDKAYPEIDIEYVKLEGEFSPRLIHELSGQWSIPTNLMFVGSPGDHFMFGISELGGVRLII
ncbi:APC family permease [Planctomycetes bacterium TBK1r]|uniref:Amino acid permease YhdG n=1 Tax=Stieleria magnilauensis TaxID=2527963 RepID=A0ABX5XWZ2_9BACT|nr:putative amino acid permease YhdG [Planctomycetes bacterium TBK1r]